MKVLHLRCDSVSRSNSQRSGLQTGGGIPCRPNPAATLLVVIGFVWFWGLVPLCGVVEYRQLPRLTRQSARHWSHATDARRSVNARGTRRSMMEAARRQSTDVGRVLGQQQSSWIVPPFYRAFWFFHNVSLVSTPISFGMFISRFYEGLCRIFAVRRYTQRTYAIVRCLSCPTITLRQQNSIIYGYWWDLLDLKTGAEMFRSSSVIVWRSEFQTRGASCAKLRCTNAVRGRGVFSRLWLLDLWHGYMQMRIGWQCQPARRPLCVLWSYFRN